MPDRLPAAAVTIAITEKQHALLTAMGVEPYKTIGYFRKEATMRLFVRLGLAEPRMVKVYLRENWFRTPAGDTIADMPWSKNMKIPEPGA